MPGRSTLPLALPYSLAEDTQQEEWHEKNNVNEREDEPSVLEPYILRKRKTDDELALK